MWDTVDRLCGFVIDAGVSATLLWAVAALAMLGCRQPARRLRLARVAILASLAIPFVIAIGLVPRIDLVTNVGGLASSPNISPPRRLATEDPTSSENPRFAARLDPAREMPIARGPWPARLVTLVYLVGLGCGVAWLLLGFLALDWVSRQTSTPSQESLSLYRSLTFKPLRDRPRLRLSPRVSRPVLVGSWSPLILVPPVLDRPEARDRLRLTLLHELAHAEALDPAFGLLGNVAQALWFFVPPVWWVVAQVRLDQEFLADRRASAKFGPVGAYASSLLDLASTRVGEQATSRGSTDGTAPRIELDAPGSSLFQRVLMLIRCPFPIEPSAPASWSWTLPCLAVLLTFAVSSVSVRIRETSAESAPSHSQFKVLTWETPMPKAGGTYGRSPVHELPLLLPDRFDLSVEVSGDLPTLAATRVVGARLVSPKFAADATAGRPDDPPRWHEVRLRRGADGVSLWIDGKSAPLDNSSQKLTAWLSVETAPDQRGKFRNLVVEW